MHLLRTVGGMIAGSGLVALFPAPVWAHGSSVAAGAVGWADEIAWVLGSLIVVLAVGWMTLDGRRSARKAPKGRRSLGRR